MSEDESSRQHLLLASGHPVPSGYALHQKTDICSVRSDMSRLQPQVPRYGVVEGCFQISVLGPTPPIDECRIRSNQSGGEGFEVRTQLIDVGRSQSIDLD